MFRKKHRARRADFRISSTGTTQNSENFSVRRIPTDTPRVAVVVSKKVAKQATQRNTLKRRIIHEIKHIQLPEQQTIIVYPRKTALTTTPIEIRTELQKALRT